MVVDDRVYRASFSLPADQATLLSGVAQRLGVTQSAVVTVMLELLLPTLAENLGGTFSPNTKPRRLRGATSSRLRAVLADALRESARTIDQVKMF